MDKQNTHYKISIVAAVILCLIVGVFTAWAINGAIQAEIQSVAGAALITYPFAIALPCIAAITGSIFSIISAKTIPRRILGICLLIINILTPVIGFSIIFTTTINLPAA